MTETSTSGITERQLNEVPPKGLILKIFQGRNALPVIERVHARFTNGWDHDYELTPQEEDILLTRADRLSFPNREGGPDVPYCKQSEEAKPPTDIFRRRGATITVKYRKGLS